MDGSECREQADACAALAQQAQGKKRNDLLDIADNWDVLAEENDALENSELAAVADKGAQAAAKRIVLHLPSR
jgi:hypothetical protein